MPLTPMREIMEGVLGQGGGVGAFNVIQLEHAEAFVVAAERRACPLVLQISQNCARYHGALEPIALATLAIARSANVPVCVHLDHAESAELVQEAVALGIGSIMFDASKLPYRENVSSTRTVVDYCRSHGVWVEAELGAIGGKDGVHDAIVHTDPLEASAFVEATGVDALAVAVGTSHAMLVPSSRIDFDLVRALRAAVPVPLVLHGSSGVALRDLRHAVEAGLTKINVATRFNAAFTAAVRDALARDHDLVDTRTYLGFARDALAAEAERVLEALAPSPRRSG